jgi:glycosyltransferase involved in cell wall biosynthesis
MRIGLLIYGDINTVSGGYLYNRKLVNYLREQGEVVTIISLPQRSYLQHFIDNFNQHVFQKIRNANLDVLIEDAMVHPSLVWLNRRISRELAIPLIALVHLLSSYEQHSVYWGWFYRAIERHYLQSVNGFIANSRTTHSQLQRLLAKPLSSCCIAVPAGDHFVATEIERSVIEQRTQMAGRLRILVVGNVIRRKGLHVLIKALQQLPSHQFQVIVVGSLDMEPNYVQQVKVQIQSAGLQQTIVFLGVITGQALANLYQQHQLMVLPSAYESYGIVYLEAQQFGLPVIGTTAGAAHEVIMDGKNGFLIAPEDWQALANLLQQLQDNRQNLLAISLKAQTTYRQHPKWDDSCQLIQRYLYNLKYDFL